MNMKKTSKAASVIALSLLVGSIGFAQGADAHGRGSAPKAQKAKVVAKKEVKASAFASAATLLGLTEADLHTQLHATAGQTLAALATTLKGWTTDEFIAKLVEAETEKIDAQVTANTITVDQATALKAVLQAKLTTFVNKAHQAAKEGAQVEVKADLLATAATLLEVTKTELHTKLHATSGTTLVSIATSLKGWTQDEFVSKIVEAQSAKIDAQVTANTLTAEKAAELKAGLNAEVTKFATKAHGVKPTHAAKPEKPAKAEGKKGGKGKGKGKGKGHGRH